MFSVLSLWLGPNTWKRVYNEIPISTILFSAFEILGVEQKQLRCLSRVAGLRVVAVVLMGMLRRDSGNGDIGVIGLGRYVREGYSFK
jgi:hypothetical protein